tara:strand:+ start:60 stop:218 length:159 start_codon:yes stop_codon:yes gene_type:complete
MKPIHTNGNGEHATPYSKKQSKELKQVSYHFEFDYDIWVLINKRGNKRRKND